MFKRLFGLTPTTNQTVIDALYDRIVAAARQPVPYADWDVPDTPIGRFEMLSLHVFLILHRLRGEEQAGRDIAQELTDEFFKDVEHSLRELGISDQGVPKRMKKLARMFYGRVAAYSGAIEANDAAALAEALRRNVRPGEESWPQAGSLARYALLAEAELRSQPTARLLTGEVVFPSPAASVSGQAA